jgi:hypothetical protein
MTSGCIFCGASPTTKTHVFRKAWVERIMPAGPTGYFFHHARTGGSGRGFDRTWRRDSFDIQPHAACSACNSGWMHELEQQGEDLVAPCVLGSGLMFRSSTHAVLSRWILMCMVVLDQILESPVVEQPVRDALKDDPEPPRDCLVWLAATESTHDEVNAWPRAWHLAGGSDSGNGYFCTFRIKHFVAQGFIPLGTTPPDLAFDRSGGSGKHVVKVWPSTSDFGWPPPLLIPVDQLEEFSRAFEV